MTEKINWNLNAQIIGGPKILASDIIDIDAYDTIYVTIKQPEDTGVVSQKVEIQPGGEGKVKFLLIKSDNYSFDDNNKLTYKVNDLSDEIIPDAMHVPIGTGAVGLLHEPPEILEFSNGLSTPVIIEILVGRDAKTD